jgi:cytochrome c-type biogenesis protein CcmH
VKYVVAILAVLFASPALAVGVDEQVLADPAQEAQARTIMKDLRCLVCQNQSIEESDADMAADLRRVVRERVLAGDTGDQVHTFMVTRYGDWILMRPPVNERTWFLWLMPLILLLLGGLAARSLMRRNNTIEGEVEAPLSAEEQAELDGMLREGKG